MKQLRLNIEDEAHGILSALAKEDRRALSVYCAMILEDYATDNARDMPQNKTRNAGITARDNNERCPVPGTNEFPPDRYCVDCKTQQSCQRARSCHAEYLRHQRSLGEGESET
jgi:hypothetical protein